METKKDKKIHADAKHAKAHGKSYVETDSYLELAKSHKDWYQRGAMGKQRGKPKYAPPKEMKSRKTWKRGQ